MIARAVLGLAIACAACDRGEPTPDWSRMIIQPKLVPYDGSELFADQRAMRPPPAGAVAREALVEPVAADLAAIPGPITRERLARGRDRYAIACAPCHGLAGDGDTIVARSMQRRRPPSLHEPRITALTPGAMYRVIELGYGVMPSYASLLRPDDRWAVVAYVRTLELAWHASLDALPPSVRDQVAGSLR